MNTDQKILEKSILSHTEETIRIIENYEEQEIAAFIEPLPVESSSLILSQMNRFKAAQVLQKTDLKTAGMLIEKLPIPVAKVLLWQIDQSLRDTLLSKLPPQSSKPLKLALKYPEHTVGAYLDPMVFTLQENETIQQGLEKVKKSHLPILPHVYIVGPDQSLVGFIELKELITTDKETPIRSIMNINTLNIPAGMNISALKKESRWDEFIPYLPVVDGDGVFLGVITKKTLADIKPEKKETDLNALQAGVALGDLYQIGLSGFFQGAREVIDNQKIK